ncbi:peptidase S16 [Panacibacter ginsenosidivorans]|uniref:Peptidase S16 n=1 Tax=Panacibacter ginsenosidivorans TaxID=1813871 RepID=A0A5B8V837_9BACT|nr:LON peptidase substrate-binding domain-containing protein [Panacibacter ginsenosidivorans]QEC67700.1 peptidase S16 [Panacibacter ginsenosidivorans]
MINFIPIFPLGIVVYPGESLNLHVFEERYKQLITESFKEKKPFGIPSVVNNNVTEMGTLVKITEIVQVYEDGKMDIRTEGISVFRVLEVIKRVPDKLYSGAIVDYPPNETQLKVAMMQQVINGIRELHRVLKVSKEIKKPDEQLTSYDIAHHAGLTLEEEYELLGLLREDQRIEYLKRHLNKILPMINGIENLKEKIQLNGHFRELKGFNFDF